MLAALLRLSNQFPPRLKALLNLAISVTLVLFATPLLWSGFAERNLGSGAMGAGLALLAVFNLFT